MTHSGVQIKVSMKPLNVKNLVHVSCSTTISMVSNTSKALGMRYFVLKIRCITPALSVNMCKYVQSQSV